MGSTCSTKTVCYSRLQPSIGPGGSVFNGNAGRYPKSITHTMPIETHPTMAAEIVDDYYGPRPRKTNTRYLMIFLAMMVAVLLYLDRICLSTASTAIEKDLALETWQMDWLLGAFFWTYAFAQLPAGWLGDRFGARWILTAYIILWSLSTGLMGIANGWAAIFALRLFCGLFEAGAYPVAAGIVRRWTPPNKRGIASSIVAVGGRLGGAIAPILTIQLMLIWTFGSQWWDLDPAAIAAPPSWRPVMILYGVIGIAIAFVFLRFFRDTPREHPKTNSAERAYIDGVDLETTDAAIIEAQYGNSQHGKSNSDSITSKTTGVSSSSIPDNRSVNRIPLREMLGSFSLWMVCLVQFVSNLGWAFLITKMPQYLREVHSTSQSSIGWLQSAPLIAGTLGLLAGGLFTDWSTVLFGLRWGRAIALSAARVIVALAFLTASSIHTSYQASICLAVVGFATDLGTPACWAYGQDVGRKYAGSVVGWFNMWGNVGAAISPVLLGYIVGTGVTPRLGWQAAFLTCAAINAVSIFAALAVTAEKPLVKETSK